MKATKPTRAAKARDAVVAAGQGLALGLLSLIGSVTLYTLAVTSIALIPVGIGVLTTPAVLKMVRAHANQRRLLAASWAGTRIPLPYRPLPQGLRPGITGQVERCTFLLKDPATWRDLLWMLVDMSGGAAVALLAPGLLGEGIFGLVIFLGLWKPLSNGGTESFWFDFVPVSDSTTALFAGLVGLCWIALGMRFGRQLVNLHFSITKGTLAPTKEAELSRRIDRLTETRHDAVDSSAAELRRIERDLHDGAQARLVAMGMNLSTVEALIEKDPAQAKKLLSMARESSAEALTELRDLVRGIHPPVLAERGLGDAVRALALRLPVRTEVEVDMDGRPEAPVESAAYFAVSETLTNAVKHSGGDRIWVDIHHADGMLRMSVTDDGRGGAVIGKGSGLSGIERRLGTFDGVLAVSSPAGGPTMVTMEIPCALSSPKTSSS
ncbi:sensor histidine kinase [Streptomyces sp. NBC_01387]|uniref:sensor histidine kinase n=1 Tax=unclassified Streptomyces TaxID=2593676 RepID=UPI0020241990|nr:MULTISPECIES: sensor histidine kinase [unclassified Streptomyces]MCX4551519.1 sensor histidine kinase [Streptomyces sp. NBC_01500]WSC22903.1 sensor histidine kinase [Streptomyces sp. NBC_01766]WSV56814.1 sensor histidine kinase [Streptomyces sp. NBC_01014]